jgi:flagellar biosynthesis component FlhA
VQHGETNSVAAVSPQVARNIIAALQRKLERPEIPVVIIATAATRYFLRQMAETTLPNVYFLSHNEIPGGVRVTSLGVIRGSDSQGGDPTL